jgi:hypothetical protein
MTSEQKDSRDPVSCQDLKTFSVCKYLNSDAHFASGHDSDGKILVLNDKHLSEWTQTLIEELLKGTGIGMDDYILADVLTGLAETEYDQESFKVAVRRLVIEELEMSADTRDIYCHLTGADIKVEFPEEEEELTQSTGEKPGRVEKMESFAMVNYGRGKMCFLSEDGLKRDNDCIKKIRMIVHYKFDRAVEAGIVVRRSEFFLHDVFESIMHKQFCLFTFKIFHAWIDHCIADDLTCHIDTIKTLENIINYE